MGFEVKWDANRDPNQKLIVTVDISNPVPYNYEGNFVVSYPGKTINGLYTFLWDGKLFLFKNRNLYEYIKYIISIINRIVQLKY